MFATVCNSLQYVRNEVAKPHHWATLTKCDQDDVLEVADAILEKRVTVIVSFSGGRRSTLCMCALQFRGRRSIW